MVVVLNYRWVSPASAVPAASGVLPSAPCRGHSDIPAVAVNEDGERCSCFSFNFTGPKKLLNSCSLEHEGLAMEC